MEDSAAVALLASVVKSVEMEDSAAVALLASVDKSVEMEDSAAVALLASVDKSADVTAPPPSVSRELKAVEIVLSKKTVYSDKPYTVCTSLAKLVVFGRLSMSAAG
jgi:hypothetical protein